MSVPNVVAPNLAIGCVDQPWPGVQRIAVVRGGGLGDLLMAVPAMQALAAAYADAEFVLLCAPPLTTLFTGRPSPITRALPLPATPGVYDPGSDGGEPFAADAFQQWLRCHPIDLAVQLHGGGRWSNPFVKSLRPTWTVGTRAQDAEPLTRYLPYRLYQHEILRWLEVVGLAGAPPVGLEPSIEVTDDDRSRAQQVLPPPSGPLVAVHPGARDPRRRWPAEHFATVVRECIRGGARVLILGTAAERPVLHQIAERAAGLLPATAGNAVTVLSRLDLSALCGVLDGCDVLVGNDSGVRHLAQAIGTPTVGIFLPTNLLHYGPFGRFAHRALVSWTTRCPVCGNDSQSGSASDCDHDVSFVTDVSPDAVLDEVRDLLA